MCKLKILKNGINLYAKETNGLVPYAERISLIQFTLCQMGETPMFVETISKRKKAIQNSNWKLTMGGVYVHHATPFVTLKDLK